MFKIKLKNYLFLALFSILSLVSLNKASAVIYPATMTGGTQYDVPGTDKIYDVCVSWDNSDPYNPVCTGSSLFSGYEGIDKNVINASPNCIAYPGSILKNQPAECQGDGLIKVIPDGYISDRGNSSMGDSLDLFCRNGVVRMCLSKEICPWVSRGFDAYKTSNGLDYWPYLAVTGLKIDAADSQTCTRSNLLPGDLLASASSGANFNGVTDFYCNAASQKYGNPAFPKNDTYYYCEIPDLIDNASFDSYVDLPLTVTPGQTFTASVKMKNTGNTIWSSAANYKLGSQNPADNNIWGVGRIGLTADVAPGQIGTFTGAFTAPLALGVHNFQWQMLIEGVKWFDPTTARTPNQAITVAVAVANCGTATDASGITYNTVIAQDGNCWLASNLGTSRIATAIDDAASYGWIFQWGRNADGHQIPTSATTSTLSATDVPGHANFIKSNTTWDWRSSQNNNLWQGIDGINNPCPTGFRIPKALEWDAVMKAEGITQSTQAFNSSLKLPSTFFRMEDGSINPSSEYWSSDVVSSFPNRVFSFVNRATVTTAFGTKEHVFGLSVRCIKSSVAVAADGVCGASSGKIFATAPSTFLCDTASSPSLIPSGKGPWNWSCAGSNGSLVNASCSANCSSSYTLTGCPLVEDQKCDLSKAGQWITTKTAVCVGTDNNCTIPSYLPSKADCTAAGFTCQADEKMLCPMPLKIKSWQEVAPSN